MADLRHSTERQVSAQPLSSGQLYLAKAEVYADLPWKCLQ